MMDLPIIVTRAQPGAQETADRLEALGLQAVVAPMLSLEVIADAKLPSVEEISGLVFTSANGVRTYAAREAARTLTAWCVGPATAAAAEQEGFQDIRESAGNAVDLAHFIAVQSAPTERPLLHVANAAAAGSLKANLEALGYHTSFVPLYRMNRTSIVPPNTADILQRNRPALVLIHSAKGATAFAALMREQSLQDWIAVGISEPACAPLAPLKLNAIYTSESPNEDGLFARLSQVLATLSA
ncbi:MAG: uroporphyrinogen-III synthase [Pseudomonadota bacterium]